MYWKFREQHFFLLSNPSNLILNFLLKLHKQTHCVRFREMFDNIASLFEFNKIQTELFKGSFFLVFNLAFLVDVFLYFSIFFYPIFRIDICIKYSIFKIILLYNLWSFKFLFIQLFKVISLIYVLL